MPEKADRPTHDLFSSFAGSRVHDNERLREACEVLDSLSCRDLSSLLIFMSERRVGEVVVNDVISGNRFHKISEVEQRDLHRLESHIMAAVPDVTFIELSTLQPFGTSTYLSGVNVKNVIPALRKSEVNADAATSLFRTAVQEFQEKAVPARLATHAKVTRAQVFEKEGRFLPQFKIFAEVSVGRKHEKYDTVIYSSLISHLKSEISAIETLNKLDGFRVDNIKIDIGNVLLAEELVEKGLLDNDEIRRNTTTPDYNALLSAGLDIPAELPLSNSNLEDTLKNLGFSRGVITTETFKQIIVAEAPDLLPRLTLDLSRIAGLNYYENICYKIQAQNKYGEWVPLSDGGTTDWGKKVTQDKLVYTVTSGIGTELICRHFME